MKKVLLILSVVAMTAGQSVAQTASAASVAASANPLPTLTVEAKNFASNDGMAYLMLLDKAENPIRKAAVAIRNQQVVYSFSNLPAGVYAVKLYHDANGNKVLDKGFFGMPTEGWGCSNNVRASFGPPNFKKMLFDFTQDRSVSITMN
jgi:uncharacterized protein (DUF2141 family)